MSYPIFRNTGLFVLVAGGMHGLGWAAVIFIVVAMVLSAVTVLLFLKARPNASLLEAATAWAMVLHALLGRRQKRPK
jgi:hypothetical protein